MLDQKEKTWQESEDGIVTWGERIYIPRDKKLREEIMRMNHDSMMAGHPGRFKTQELITRNYWWPLIQSDIKKYINGCEVCQRTKSKRSQPAALLNPNKTPTRPWEIVTVDFIGPLPESQGYNAIMVVVDRFTKGAHFIPTTIEITSLGTAKEFRDHVFVHHGLPRKIISDRGTQFVSAFMTDLFKLLGMAANRSTAYHPQTDGQTERVNQEIEQYLRIFINHRQTNWADWLPMAQFSYNDKIHSSTHYSPFYLNHGHHPWKGGEPNTSVKNEEADAFVQRMKKIREDAEASLNAAAETMKRFYDRHTKPSVDHPIGSRVYLEGTNIRTDRPAKKLEDKRYGPFEIIEKVGKASYKLKLPSTWRSIHPVFHESLITAHKQPV